MVKLIFSILLIAFSLSAVLFLTDYKSGQAAMFINKAVESVPMEVREKVVVISSEVRDKVKAGMDAMLELIPVELKVKMK